jgi:hypothetical protein
VKIDMDIKSGIAIGIIVFLIIFALGGTFYLFVRPVFVKAPQIVTDRNLDYIGKSPEGESAYVIAKKEITYWLEQLAKIAPVASTLLAMFIMWKKHKKEIEACRSENGQE